LLVKKDWDGAVLELSTTVKLAPDFPEAHCNLGHALRPRGDFVAALVAYRRGHELGSKRPGWPYPSEKWIQECEGLVILDRRLAAILEEKSRPTDTAERLTLASLCCTKPKKLYVAASCFYEEAFSVQPDLAGDRPSEHRYNAACAAALAGCGEGADADTLDTTARARLRQQALDWLRADLAAWHKVLTGDRSKAAPAVRQQMQHWLQDADFAGVRGPQALAQLPEAERSAWRKLWAEAEELFVQAGGKASGPDK
jgi:serine/threonine-protein kinase